MEDHEASKAFKCEQCDKEFHLEWRLNQHIRGHSEIDQKCCHYYKNSKICPFEKNGCKFRHEVSVICNFGKHCRNTLCQFRHEVAKKSIVIEPNECDKYDFEEGIKSNSTTIKDNDALDKLRYYLKGAIEKASALKNDNEEKEKD